jgi:membrane protease YdiL (CAAX protease family)
MFFQAARRGDNAFFKYFLTIISVIGAMLLGQLPLTVAVGVALARDYSFSDAEVNELLRSMDFTSLGIDQNVALALMLLPFVIALGTLYLCIVFLHRKRFADVLTGRGRLDWGRIRFAFVFWLALTAAFELAAYLFDPGNYAYQFELAAFLPLLLIALFMLPLQTTFEEALLRGYLLQGLGLAFRNRWLPLLLTSAVFALLHFANPEVGEFGFGLMMAYYLGFGLVMGLCTLMDEGTELAIGLHAATNVYGATMVSFAGSALQTPAIFRLQELNAELMLGAAFVAAAIFMAAAAYRYQWRDWGKLLLPIALEAPPLAAAGEEEREEMG